MTPQDILSHAPLVLTQEQRERFFYRVTKRLGAVIC